MKKLILIGSLLTLLTVSFIVLAGGKMRINDTKKNPNCENCKVDISRENVSTN